MSEAGAIACYTSIPNFMTGTIQVSQSLRRPI
jgi:hypothetical protein